MTYSELYSQFGIKPAEFKHNETSAEFGRRVMSSSSSIDQTGVIYSTGSQLEKVDINQHNHTDYQLYSY